MNDTTAGDPKPAPGRRHHRAWLAVVGLLAVVHVALGTHCAWRASVTHDEYWHLPAGLAVWKQGRFDADELNPPLSRAWAALPLAIMGIPLGEPAPPNDSTALGDHFLDANLDRYHELYVYGRMMNLAWSVLTGVLIAVWGRELFGEPAGVVGAALWFLCPVVLSNAALVTPDVCPAFFFLATTYSAWRFAQAPTGQRAAVLGAVLGLAQLSKFTCVLLFPVVIAVWFLVRAKSGLPRIAVRRGALQWLLVLAVCLVVLNAGYLFRGSGQPENSFKFASRSLKWWSEMMAPIGRVWIPAPHDYVTGFDRQRSIMEAAHPVFLDRTWVVSGGYRDYYLRACAYKWPHAIQALVLTALACSLFARTGRRLWRSQGVLLAPAALVVGIASFSQMQLGIRYILPAFPLIYLFAGQVGTWLAAPRRVWKTAWLGVCLAALPFGLRYHPHHLAYFNELSGGPERGEEHLLDSNLDWGQDLLDLRAYLREHDVETIGLAYFGMVPPAKLGIEYHLPPSSEQIRDTGYVPPGWYAVSVNFVSGRPHTIRNPDGQIRSTGPKEFAYFQLLPPETRIGWSIYVYRIRAEPGDSP